MQAWILLFIFPYVAQFYFILQMQWGVIFINIFPTNDLILVFASNQYIWKYFYTTIPSCSAVG